MALSAACTVSYFHQAAGTMTPSLYLWLSALRKRSVKKSISIIQYYPGATQIIYENVDQFSSLPLFVLLPSFLSLSNFLNSPVPADKNGNKYERYSEMGRPFINHLYYFFFCIYRRIYILLK